MGEDYNPMLEEFEQYVERWLDSNEAAENYFQVGIHDNGFDVPELRIKYFSEYNEEDETSKTVVLPSQNENVPEEEEVERWVDQMKDDHEEDLNGDKTGISNNIEWGNAD